MSFFFKALLTIAIVLVPLWSPAQASYEFAFSASAPVTMKGFETVNCAFQEAQLPVLLRDVPWKRAQAGTQNGTYDGFFLGSKNQDRAQFSVPSDPIDTFKWYYVVLADADLNPQQKDFFRQSFAANQGTARLKWLEKRFARVKGAKTPIAPNSIESSWSMLKFGRVDVLLENETNVQKFRDQVDVKIFPAVERSVHVHFSRATLKKNAQLLSRFNKGLQVCQALRGTVNQ